MKKVFSTLVAALIAVSFAGIVCAAEPAKEAAPMPAGHPPIGEKAAKPVKKAKKVKKTVKKEAAKPAAEAAAPAAPAK